MEPLTNQLLSAERKHGQDISLGGVLTAQTDLKEISGDVCSAAYLTLVMCW